MRIKGDAFGITFHAQARAERSQGPRQLLQVGFVARGTDVEVDRRVAGGVQTRRDAPDDYEGDLVVRRTRQIATTWSSSSSRDIAGEVVAAGPQALPFDVGERPLPPGEYVVVVVALGELHP